MRHLFLRRGAKLLLQQCESVSTGMYSSAVGGQVATGKSFSEVLWSNRTFVEKNRSFMTTTSMLLSEEKGDSPFPEGDAPIDLDKPQEREIGTPRIRALADEICNMTLLDMADLTEILQEKLKIPAVGPGAMFMGGGMMPMQAGAGMMAADGAEGAADAGAAKAEKTEFDLKLASYDKATKIKVIKEIRVITELGLKEAKELVENTPAIIKKQLSKDECQAIIDKLKEVGAECVME